MNRFAYFTAALLLTACGSAVDGEPTPETAVVEPAPSVPAALTPAPDVPRETPPVSAVPTPAPEVKPPPAPVTAPPALPAPEPVLPPPAPPAPPVLTPLGAACATDAECADPDAVCLPDGDAAGVSGRAVCRLPRLELHERCGMDEAYVGAPHPCEPGLWCRPYGIAGLRCVEFTL